MMSSTTGGAGSTPGHHSIATLVQALCADVGTLVRLEIALAMTDAARLTRPGLSLLDAARVLGVFAVGILITAAILALASILPAWLAALIVGVVVATGAGGLALLAGVRLAKASPSEPEQ